MKVRIIKAGTEATGYYYQAQYRKFFQWFDMLNGNGRPLRGYSIQSTEERMKEAMENKVVKEWTI